MLTFNTFNLTSEQIEAISIYRSKWEKIARSTETIDRERATTAIINAYEFIELPEPNLIFFSNPYQALNHLHQNTIDNWGKLDNSLFGKPIAGELVNKLLGNIRKEVREELLIHLQGDLDDGISDRLALETSKKFQDNEILTIVMANVRLMANSSNNDFGSNNWNKMMFDLFFEAGFVFNQYISPAVQQFTSLFNNQQETNNNFGKMFSTLLTSKFNRHNSDRYQLPFVDANSSFINLIMPSVMADFAYYVDYCHDVLNCDRDEIKWNIFQDLITSCGWIFPYKNTVLVCDRYFL